MGAVLGYSHPDLRDYHDAGPDESRLELGMRDGLTIGALAYEAYGNAVEWTNHVGKPMPKWADLPDKIRAAWQAAADAVTRGEL